MKKLILICMLFSGCATQKKVTLDELMRTSYEIGCGEARLAYIEADGKDHRAAMEGVVRLCMEKGKKEFDLHQTGIYEDGMEITKRERPQGKERN